MRPGNREWMLLQRPRLYLNPSCLYIGQVVLALPPQLSVPPGNPEMLLDGWNLGCCRIAPSVRENRSRLPCDFPFRLSVVARIHWEVSRPGWSGDKQHCAWPGRLQCVPDVAAQRLQVVQTKDFRILDRLLLHCLCQRVREMSTFHSLTISLSFFIPFPCPFFISPNTKNALSETQSRSFLQTAPCDE